MFESDFKFSTKRRFNRITFLLLSVPFLLPINAAAHGLFVQRRFSDSNFKIFLISPLQQKITEGAIVAIKRNQNWEKITEVDSLQGCFLTQHFKGRILVKCDDYENIDTNLMQWPENREIYLYLKPLQFGSFNDVVISNNRGNLALKENTASTTVLKPYLVENKVTFSGEQILDQLPGVSVSDKQASIRSGSGWSYGAGSRVMVTMDDLPMLSADAGQVQWSFLPLENLQAIEVIKSPGSVLYGSSALNGVINFTTAEADSQLKLQIQLFSGVYDKPKRSSYRFTNSLLSTTGINGFVSKKIHSTSFILQWNGLNDKGFRLNEFEDRMRIALKIKHYSKKIKNLILGVNNTVQLSNSGSFLLWESYQKPYTSLDSGFNQSKTQRWAIDPFLHYHLKNSQHKLLHRFFYLNNEVDNGNPNNNQSNSSYSFYTEYRFNSHLFDKKMNLSAGLVSLQNRTNSPLFGGTQKANNYAVYLQVEHKISKHIFSAGGRYEYYTLNDFSAQKPVFRLGYNLELHKYTFFRASWGQGFRLPSMAEAFTATSVGPVKIYPNPHLQPETGWNAEMGLKQYLKIKKLKGFVDVALFHQQFDNMMEFTFAQWSSNLFPPTFGFGFKSVNIGKATITGFELETGWDGKLNKNNLLQIIGGYTYTKPEIKDENYVFASDSTGKQLSFSNTRSDTNLFMKYRFLHNIKFDIQWTHKMLEIGLSMRAVSKLLNIDAAFENFPINLFVPGIKESRQELKAPLVFDCRIAYQINKRIKFNVQVQNIFNRLYLGRPSDMRPPRSFQVQFTYKLN